MSWDPAIEEALEAIRGESEEAAGDAAAAFGWLIGEQGPEGLSEARLQEFLWSVIPRKFMVPLDDQHGVALALGRAMEILGLPRYAELCRSAQTMEVLRA